MKVVAFEETYERIWNDTVAESRNGTFLLDRKFMDYHRQRFQDVSLLALDEKGNCLGVLPANARKENLVESHGGLTYGGLILSKKVSTILLKEIMVEVARFYLRLGCKSLLYKAIPYIYHTYPTNEDLYWLFRAGARLTSRGISTTVDLHSPIPFTCLRKRKAKKAEANSLGISSSMVALAAFWRLLEEVLGRYHGIVPVHSLEEMSLLMHTFPDAIKVYTVHPHGDASTVLAGCLLFLTRNVAHVQYIAAGEAGRDVGALDFLFDRLINSGFLEQRYLDFGISTERGGSYLNEGLIFQKEGFGGRGVCYDAYLVDLERMAHL